ncbi:hypothetical protein BCR44DRAFT_1174626 [Catenaria anguillulae PL171]|uniref:Uncharacterized protein n=1 Tax=Catenaria anguillulae PL171 TaxID=765915 RepID=A0A1Y2I394_9FUNG|nr:hypothetical protein BCR44DRAFT_1174626 [Catenaria anguillulae PL171]
MARFRCHVKWIHTSTLPVCCPRAAFSETLIRYNQVLTPVLDLLSALVSLHPVQVAPGASAGSVESTSILVKTTTQFLEAHGGSMTRIARAAASLLSHRPPDDDHSLEVAILHQVKQIACITRFLVRNRAPVSPELTTALLDVFVQGTQSEAATGKLPQRRSTITDRTLLHALADIVNLCFTRVFERPANAELSGSRFMFDLDLSVAQNKYYAQRTRPSLGSLALFVHQVLAQHRITRSSLKELGARLADGVAARGSTTINDWNKYVVRGRTSQDVAIQVQYQSVPEAKRAEMIQNRMISVHRQLEIDAASHVRMLETAMAVLVLHLRHWAAGGSSLAEVAQQQQQELHQQQQLLGARASGRAGYAQRAARQMSSAIRKDAQDVFAGLEQAVEAVEWAEEEANAKRVLLELCKQSADLIAGFPQ